MGQRNQYSVGFGAEIPPRKEFVRIYFIQKGMSEIEADLFFATFELTGWECKGGSIKNWKTLASEWIWQLRYNSS